MKAKVSRRPAATREVISRATSADVARAAGVSRSAVSRSFTPGTSVAPATREKVFAAAAKLSYRPNALARILNSGSSEILGVVIGDLANPFYPYLLEQLTRRLQAAGYTTLLFTVGVDESVDELIPLVMQYQVSALIVTSATLSSRLAQLCAAQGLSVILLNRTVPGALASSVCCDNVVVGRMAADILSGADRIAFVSGRADTSTNAGRRAGFEQRLAELAKGLHSIIEGEYRYDIAFSRIAERLRQPSRPDALFCANDIMALAALDAARAVGLDVPGDLSVLGCDNIPAAAWPSYQLSTIAQPVSAMLDKVVECISEKRLDNGVVHLIAPSYVERTTVQRWAGRTGTYPNGSVAAI